MKELAYIEAKYPDPKTYLIGFSSAVDNKNKLTDRRQARQSADFEGHLSKKGMFGSVVNAIETEVRKKSKERADVSKYHAETTKAEKTLLTKYYSTERQHEPKPKGNLNNQENSFQLTTTKLVSKITKKKVIKDGAKNSYRRTRNENKSVIQNIKTVVLEKAKMVAKMAKNAHEKSELYCIAENASPECESYREYEKGFSDIEVDDQVKDLSKNKIKLNEYIKRQHQLRQDSFKENSISYK